MSVGAPYVYEQARLKLGRVKSQEWLYTPNPELEDGIAPAGLLESGCPTCINKVWELLEEME